MIRSWSCGSPRVMFVCGFVAVLALSAGLSAQLTERRFGDNGPSRTPVDRVPPSFSQQLDRVEGRASTPLRTELEFTILTPRFGGALEAQRWARSLSDLGVDAHFRPPIGGDELGVDQLSRGTYRIVRVVGRLTMNGLLELNGQTYSSEAADVRRLKEWIDDLKTYGAQGSPQGQPLWGLNEAQFGAIYESLSKPVEKEVEDLPFQEALAVLPLPAAHPLRSTAESDAWLQAHPAGKAENRLQGLSCGTVLAMVLREAGLGMFPNRTPDGRVELALQPLSAGGQVWPVGWAPAEDVDQGALVPILHKFSEIGFEDAALQDVLDATAAAIEVPILVDYLSVRDSGVDLSEKAVSYPLKRTTWALMLNSVIRKAYLIKEIRVDEQGKPFVYIAPFVPTPVERAQ